MSMDKFLVALGVTTLIAYVATAIIQPETASEGLETTADMFVQALPWIIVSMFAAGLIAVFIDPHFVARLLGREAGIQAIAIGAMLGLFGTGSRWAVYPIAAGLMAADASPGAVFAFMTSWQLVSLPRLPAEVPFFGLQFTLLRAVVSLIIAFIGGLMVEWFESRF
jgi:uncharacterized membrane protein YraQ (UPF0718 family)